MSTLQARRFNASIPSWLDDFDNNDDDDDDDGPQWWWQVVLASNQFPKPMKSSARAPASNSQKYKNEELSVPSTRSMDHQLIVSFIQLQKLCTERYKTNSEKGTPKLSHTKGAAENVAEQLQLFFIDEC